MVRRICGIVGYLLLGSCLSATDDVNGLEAEYFRGSDWKESLLKRIEPNIDCYWNEGAPHESVPADHFSVRWSGYLKSPEKGRYELTLIGDDGSRLFLDDRLVIDAWQRGGPALEAATVELTGRPQKLVVEYREHDARAYQTLWWRPLGADRSWIVPTEALFPDEKNAVGKGKRKFVARNGLSVEYFDDRFQKNFGRAIVSRAEAVWHEWNPHPGMPIDGAARYSGFLIPPITGQYKLFAHGDDTVRIWIEDSLVLEARWDAKPVRSTIELEAGKAYPVRIELVDQERHASYYLHWTVPGGTQEISIPVESLYPSRQSLPKGIEVKKKSK